MSLPNLELKYTKVSERKNSNTNTNDLHSTINNNIIVNQPSSNEAQTGQKTTDIPKSSSSVSLSRAATPDNIKQFKEALILILISYFKNNIILLNNLAELSEKIVTKVDDLKLLISLLTEEPISNIYIDVEELTTTNCCGEICKRLPRYRKIKEIIINKKQTFQVSYNQYYIQMGTEFNISLEYVLL
jgi:hypothetical protein